MDYRELLKSYMRHIIAHHGDAYLDPEVFEAMGGTDQEWEALLDIELEVEHGLNTKT